MANCQNRGKKKQMFPRMYIGMYIGMMRINTLIGDIQQVDLA